MYEKSHLPDAWHCTPKFPLCTLVLSNLNGFCSGLPKDGSQDFYAHF